MKFELEMWVRCPACRESFQVSTGGPKELERVQRVSLEMTLLTTQWAESHSCTESPPDAAAT